MKEYIENVLAPKLQGDGGWVEFVSYENKKLTLIFRGECSKCLILNRCVDWIAQQIKEAKGETVEITAVQEAILLGQRVMPESQSRKLIMFA